MVAHARIHGWRKAVSDILALRHPRLSRYITDEAVGDWLDLLPAWDYRAAGSALCVGGALSTVPLLLADSCERVVIDAPPADLAFLEARAREHGSSNIEPISYPLDVLVEQFDLVAGLRHAPELPAPRWRLLRLRELANRVKPGGYIYLEIDHPSILVPPSMVKLKLRSLGFTGITLYWPKPSFDACEMLVQLGDRRLQYYYLSTIFFSTSAKRGALKLALEMAVRLGIFELTLPGYMVIARRKHGKAQAGKI